MKKSIYSIAKVVVVVFTMIILLTSFETQEISAATAKPSKVKGITVVKTTNSSIKFKWKKVKRAFSYKIYRKRIPQRNISV